MTLPKMAKRWEMAVMLFSGAVIAYTQRVNISVASQQIAKELNWGLAHVGLFLSAFYWGYTVGQISAPPLVRHFGPAFVFGLSTGMASLTTLFIPAATRAAFPLVLVLLFLLGCFQSILFPAVYQFIPLWIPLEQKTLMVPLIFCGTSMGNIVGYSVCSRLINVDIRVAGRQIGDWDACFYVFGLLGLAWLPLWLWRAYDSPNTHPTISEEEKRYINEGKHYPHEEEVNAYISRSRSRSRSRSVSSERMPDAQEVAIERIRSFTRELLEEEQGMELPTIIEESSTTPQSDPTPSESRSEQSKPVVRWKEDHTSDLATGSPIELVDCESNTYAADNDIVASTVEDVHRSMDFSVPRGRKDSTDSRTIERTRDTAATQSSRISSRSAHLSVKYPRYEDDHLEHDFSEPIALENVGMNMAATASSKVSRIDGLSQYRPGRPRAVTIVAHSQQRKALAEDIPWMNFVTHPVALTLILNHWTSAFISYTLMSEMPAFLSDALGFDLSKAGMLSVFPYIAVFFFNIVFGNLFEFFQTDLGFSVNFTRRSAEFIGFILSTGFLLACSFVPNPNSAYVFMVFTQGMTGATHSGLACAYSDVAPNYSSALNTLANIIASVAGIAGPLIVSAVLSVYPGIWGWRIVFFIAFGQAAVAIVFWFTFQTSKPIPELNNPKTDRLGWYATH